MDEPAKMAAMESWLDEVCAALEVDRSAVAGVTPAVLDLVGDVAHGPSRPAAPLTASAMGLAAGSPAAGDGDLAARVSLVLARLEPLLARYRG